MNNTFKLKDSYLAVLKERNIPHDVQANTGKEGEIESWSIFPSYASQVSSANQLTVVISKDEIAIFIFNIIKNVENKEKMSIILNSWNNGFGSNTGVCLSMDTKNFVSLCKTTYYDFLNLDDKINIEIINRAAAMAMEAADYSYRRIMEEYYSA